LARRIWTEDEIATTLAYHGANGGNQRQTSRACGVPLGTLQSWLRKAKTDTPRVADSSVESAKQKLADRIEDLAHELAGKMSSSAGAAAFKDLAVGFGIAVDKMQLLRKQPTQINEVREVLTAEERVDMLKAIFDRAAQRRDEAALPSLAETGGQPN